MTSPNDRIAIRGSHVTAGNLIYLAKLQGAYGWRIPPHLLDPEEYAALKRQHFYRALELEKLASSRREKRRRHQRKYRRSRGLPQDSPPASVPDQSTYIVMQMIQLLDKPIFTALDVLDAIDNSDDVPPTWRSRRGKIINGRDSQKQSVSVSLPHLEKAGYVRRAGKVASGGNHVILAWELTQRGKDWRGEG